MVGTIAGMARPKKTTDEKRETEQVRLLRSLMYRVRVIAATQSVDASEWIESKLAPIINREWAALPDRIRDKGA